MFKKKIYSNNLFFLRYMPNLNLWQKIYSKTKYKRSKSDCVITIGFGLVFLFWKDRKFTEILLFIFSLNALKILAFQVSYFVFFSCFFGIFCFSWSLYFRVFCRPREGYLYSSIYMVNPYRCQFMVMQLLMEL